MSEERLRAFCQTCQMPRIFRDGTCWKCGSSASLAPFGPEARARWPVPDWVKGYSTVDAFMWWAAQGMRQFFPDEPHTEFYNDFSGHALRCGDLRLTLEWDVRDEISPTRESVKERP